MTAADRIRAFASRHAPWLALAYFALLAFAMFMPLFTRHAFFLWDVPDQYWPDLQYLCGALHDGVWPLWNPYDRVGYPFHADPQSGAYNPLNLAICAVAGRAPSLFWAELRVPIYFALAGCGMTAFLRALELPWAAALTGGTAFMLAPYQRGMWEVNLTYTIALLPWVLLAIEALARAPSPRTAAWLALAIALATSIGSPPSLYFTVFTCGAYALFRLARDRRLLAPLALAGALAIALCAVMILPTGAMARASVQHNTTFASISADAYRLSQLAGLVWPRNKYLYLGVPACALAVYGAWRSTTPRAARIFWAALALFAMTMTFGGHTPVYRVAFDVVPGVRAFRAPVRWSSVFGAASAVLVGLGAAALPRATRTAWLALAAVLFVAWPALPPDREMRDPPVPGTVARWRTLAARMGDVGSTWRMHDEFGVGLRSGTRFRARDFRGYQDPLLEMRYATVLNQLDRFPAMLEQYNVRYILRGPHFIHGTSHHFLPAGTERAIATDRGDGLWETHAPLPAAFWVDAASVLTDADAVLARLHTIAPSPVCLLEVQDHPPAVAGRERTAWQTARAVRVERNSVTVTIDAPSDGWLVVNESFDPSWVATVDGAPTPIFRANYLVRALRVPTGTHTVVMLYRPAHYTLLAALAALALATCAALIARRRAVTP